MARHIDADKIKYHKLSVCEGHGLNFEYTVAYKHEVDAIPTADVAPRSEVENYKQIAEYQQKLAMDRFFEIKRLQEDLAELKKKYTEDKP